MSAPVSTVTAISERLIVEAVIPDAPDLGVQYTGLQIRPARAFFTYVRLSGGEWEPLSVKVSGPRALKSGGVGSTIHETDFWLSENGGDAPLWLLLAIKSCMPEVPHE